MGRKKLKESNPKAGEVEVAKSTVDRIVSKPTFEYFDQPQVGVEFFIFKDKGDSIMGVVISRAIANVRRNSSYALRLDDGKIVEVFANKTLHRQLKECLFQRVRIVYIGREHQAWGHSKKIYRVYLVQPGQIEREPGQPEHIAGSLQELRKKYAQKGVKHG